MHVDKIRHYHPALLLAGVGALCTLLAVLDKVFGLVRKPLHLATFAYVCLFLLVGWAFFRGIRIRPARTLRLSAYAAFLLLNVLTAGYVLAWRMAADPTPVLVQRQIRGELARGDALLNAGDRDGAHLIYREVYRRAPNSFQALMRMGAVNYQSEDFERARRYYSRAVEQAPPDSRWRALSDLGQTYWKLGQPEAAVGFYQQAREAGIPASDRIEWHYRIAWAYFDLNDYDAAIRHYQEVAEAGEAYAAASYYNIACAQAQKIEDGVSSDERQVLVREAVQNLRRAWKATTTREEVESLRAGLLGGPEERDPELEPLRGTPEFTAFLRELPAGGS
jgi:tetratricopeptide (TPR) repeat protein